MIKIVVEILDVNDHWPQFDDDWASSGLTLNISESVLPGSAFRLPGAVDDDSGEFGVRGYQLASADETGETSALPFDIVFEPRYASNHSSTAVQ